MGVVPGDVASDLAVHLHRVVGGDALVGALTCRLRLLQDVEAGRAPEVDALVGSVVELGHLTRTPTPHIGAVYALTKLLARMIEEERSAPR